MIIKRDLTGICLPEHDKLVDLVRDNYNFFKEAKKLQDSIWNIRDLRFPLLEVTKKLEEDRNKKIEIARFHNYNSAFILFYNSKTKSYSWEPLNSNSVQNLRNIKDIKREFLDFLESDLEEFLLSLDSRSTRKLIK